MDSIIKPIELNYIDENEQAFALQLGKTFEDYGFATIENHGIEQSIIDGVIELSQQFYELPLSTKMKYHIPNIGGARGYTPFGIETAKDYDKADLKEFWHVGRSLPQDHKFSQLMPQNLDVEEIDDMSTYCDALFGAFDYLGKRILRAIAIYLNLKPIYFDKKINEGNSILRLLHYPPTIGEIEAGAIRAAAHTDINLITLLLGADEAGLQLLDNNGNWQNITAPKGSIVINIGDMLARLTNDKLPSTMHRVINPVPERAKFSRFSIPFFMHFNPDVLIETLPDCGKSKYPPITANEFLEQRLNEIRLK